MGAPVLDVSVAEIDKNAKITETEGKPVAVVMDGIVTAPGYKPIIITQTETNKFTTVSGGPAP